MTCIAGTPRTVLKKFSSGGTSAVPVIEISCENGEQTRRTSMIVLPSFLKYCSAISEECLFSEEDPAEGV